MTSSERRSQLSPGTSGVMSWELVEQSVDYFLAWRSEGWIFTGMDLRNEQIFPKKFF